jgi:hypothetical protein
MNQELPKPLQEALARQVAGDVHPSADALTAFVEHSLPRDESQRLTAHLAQCADCREIVFLASSAVEESVGDEQQSVAAAVAAPRRGGWRLWWVWAPVVAALVIVSAVVLQQRSGPGHSGQVAVAVNNAPSAPAASQPPAAAAPQPQAEMRYEVTESQKLPARAARTQGQKRSVESRPEEPITLQAHQEYRSTPTVAPAAPPASQPGLGAVAGVPKATPPVTAPMQNSFAESDGQTTTALLAKQRPVMEKPQTATPAVSGRAAWRISTDGNLEHTTAPGVWTAVLADDPTTFHVVSVVSSNVWAGGSGGALFHSSDRGETWSRQPLGTETGTIVSIQFSDAAHGVVTTDGGSRWSTSDSGVSWIKE